jgi:hypothetical protein
MTGWTPQDGAVKGRPSERADRAGAKPPLWPYLVLPAIFLLLSLTGPAFYWLNVAEYGTLEQAADANIGAAIGIMWTALWGFPWSVWPWNSPGVSQMSGHGQELVYVACALVNVLLITGFMIWRWRRVVRVDTREKEHV